MKMLLVEDENTKAKAIINVLKKENVTDAELDVVACINDALLHMSKAKYDLLIVDMCIPRTFGSDLLDDGALSLLSSVKADKHIFAPQDVIILTAHPELKEKHIDKITQSSFNMIVWNDSSIEWEGQILSRIAYRRIIDQNRYISQDYEYDVGIITAVEVEKEAVKRLYNWKEKVIKGDSANYYTTDITCSESKISVIWTNLPQMGMVSACTYAMKLANHFKPRFLVMPGIAGGTNAEYEFGDIILPAEIKDYCSGKYTTPKDPDKIEDAKKDPLKYFVPTANSLNTDIDIINFANGNHKQALLHIWENWPNKVEYKIPKVRTGFLACGTSVIQNDEIVKRMILAHQRKTDGLDMESYGVYYAAINASVPKPIPVCMKAISDFSDKEKLDDHQPYAAYVSASFMKYFIETYVAKIKAK